MPAIRAVKDLVKLAAGAAAFQATGRTPPSAYQSMISLFALTGGRSNDLMARLVGAIRPKQEVERPTGVIGELSASDVERITAEIRERGYKVFPAQLDPSIVASLKQFALNAPCVPRAKDGGGGSQGGALVYPRTSPSAVVYDFGPDLLVNNPDVQRLMADPSIAAIAQAYVGSNPVLDEVNMWWTTSGAGKADSGAAQLYHFDMDRIRWLKVFIYLTDVDRENGPHSFVSGSHRSGSIPKSILEKGYVRLSDSEVRAAFGEDRMKSFTGPSGTIILEDTRGLHKGTPALAGDRLMLEFEFSSSMFGATPPLNGTIREFHTREVREWMSARRHTYQRWLP